MGIFRGRSKHGSPLEPTVWVAHVHEVPGAQITPTRSCRPDETVKGTPVLHLDVGEFRLPVTGLHYNRQVVTELVVPALQTVGTPTAATGSKTFPVSAILVRNPANAFDSNAIEVWMPGLGAIGFVMATAAAAYAPLLDNLTAQSLAKHRKVPLFTAAGEVEVVALALEVHGRQKLLSTDTIGLHFGLSDRAYVTAATGREPRSKYPQPPG